MSFEWVVSPDVIARGLEDYGKKAMVAIQAAATYWGQLVQNEARVKAIWRDRTPAARPGIFFAVDGFGMAPITGEVSPEAKSQMKDDVEIISGDADTLIIVLGHTVFYGKYLETYYENKYAIIMSTIESNLPVLERLIQEKFRG